MPGRRHTIFVILTIAMLVFSGCANNRKEESGNGLTQYGSEGPKRVGVVFGNPGPTSAKVRNSIVNAVKKAANDFGIDYKILYPKDLVNNQESFRYLAENDYDLIIAEGEGIEGDLKKMAPQYPDIKFALFGGKTVSDNVQSISFSDNEGAFFAGVEAALLTKSGIVGFVGGSQTASHELENGFSKGVQYVNTVNGSDIKVVVTYAGVTAEAANDQERGRTLAGNLYWNGADIIFCAEGKLSTGAVKAAVENKKIVLTADLQLMNEYPWNVYGAVLEKQDNVVYNIIKKTVSGKFSGQAASYGFASGAIDFAISQALPPEIAARIASIKGLLRQGQIKPDNIVIPKGLVTEINQMPVDMNNPIREQGQR